MAGTKTGELWFELGVRDRVQKALEADMVRIKEMRDGLRDLGVSQAKIDKAIFKEYSALNKSADKYRDSLHKIMETRKKLQTSMANGLSLGADITSTEKGLARLNGYFIRLIKAANKYGTNSKQVADVLNANYTHVLRTMNSLYSAQEKLNSSQQRANAISQKNVIAENQRVAASYDKVTQSSRQAMSTLSMLRQQAGYYFSLFGAQTLLRNVITIGGQFEFQHVALQNIIGDAEKATSIFSQLKDLAVESPKTFMELTSAAKQLSAYQITANELFDTTKRLSDLSVGLGVDINRLILAYGQVRSAAVLRGQELRQFTEAGIPMVQALAKKFTEMNGRLTTTADVFKLISQRAVSFEMVRDVMWDMTNQGGQFYNMQATMADTLYGKWQKLADIWQIMLGDLASAEGPTGKVLRTMLDLVIAISRNITTMMPAISGFALSRLINSKMMSSAFGTLGSTKGIDANIAKAQQLYTIEQKRRYLLGEINREEYLRTVNNIKNKDIYYGLLAQEGRLNTLQISRLYTQGRINQSVLRELQMTGVLSTRMAALIRLQKMRGASGGLLSLLSSGGFGMLLKGAGKSALSFLGGWVGATITGLGLLYSWVSKTREGVERLNEKSKEMASSAMELSNTLNGALKSVTGSSDEISKKIEYLEEQLTNAGDQGNRIITESRGIKDVEERFRYLTEAAEAYRQVLDKIGDGGGSKIIANALHDAGFDDEKSAVTKYEDSVMDVDRIKVKMQKYSSYYGDMLDQMRSKHKDLANELNSDNIFENLERLLKSDYANEAIKFFAAGGGKRSALTEYLRALEKSEELFLDARKAAEGSLPALKAEAQELGVDLRKGFDELTDAERTKIRTVITEYTKGMVGASEDTKQRIADWLAKGFYAQLTLTPIIKTDNLDGFSEYIWNKFGGVVAGDTGTISIGGNEYSRTQVAQRFKDASNYKETINKNIDDLRKQAKDLRDAGDVADAEAKEAEAKRLEAERKAIGFSEDKKKPVGGNKSRNTVDKTLQAWKERFNDLKAFYSEYKKWAALVGREKALEKLQEDGLFGGLFADGKPIYDIDDFGKAIDKFYSEIDGKTAERRGLQRDVKRERSLFDYDKEKESLEELSAKFRESMSDISEKWDNYKTIYERTGDKSLADLVFTGGVKWDDKARAMAEEFEKTVGKENVSFEFSDEEAKKFFAYNTEEGKVLYEQWKQISNIIKNNFITELKEAADAQAEIMTNSEKIEMLEKQIAKWREDESGIDHSAQIKKNTDEIKRLQSTLFETLPIYEKIFGDRTYKGFKQLKEAESLARYIAENAVAEPVNPKTGRVDYYLSAFIDDEGKMKTLRLTREQLERLKGTLDDYHKDMSKKDPFQTLAKDIKELWDILKDGDSSFEKKETAIRKLGESIASCANIVGDFAGKLSSMYDALGNESMAGAMDDVNAAMSSISNIGSAFASGGPVGGIIAVASEAVGWIGRLAQKHDKKLDKAIQESTRRVKELQNAYKNLETEIDRALGGIYTAGGYDEMFQNYKNQLSELEKQRKAENDKKKKDQDKLLDYDQQIKEMKDTIKYFAEDMAKELYSIDIKSWAQELTDAVVEAWAKGEDAVQAWHDKVRDLVKDITKNILAKKVVEMALDPVLDYVTDQMTAKNGKLDESDVVQIAKLLESAGESSANTITSLLDAMKRAGFDMTESDSKSGNLSSSIKSITEDAGDLLVSYVNAIRADVSINREQLAQIVLLMQNMPTMNATAQLQLRQLETIAVNTGRNADSNDEILSVLRGWIVSGIYTPKIK